MYVQSIVSEDVDDELFMRMDSLCLSAGLPFGDKLLIPRMASVLTARKRKQIVKIRAMLSGIEGRRMPAKKSKAKRLPGKRKKTNRQPKAAVPFAWFYQEGQLDIVTPDRLKEWEAKHSKGSLKIRPDAALPIDMTGTCSVSFSGPTGRAWDDSRPD